MAKVTYIEYVDPSDEELRRAYVIVRPGWLRPPPSASAPPASPAPQAPPPTAPLQPTETEAAAKVKEPARSKERKKK